MKRTILFLLTMFWILPVLANAQEELHWLSPTIGGNEAVMIVDNGDDWKTRLNLRAGQRKGSEIRGRIYTGTRVELYQDNGEWCTVGLNLEGGSILTGEVMKEYLTPLKDGFTALCPFAVAKTDTEVRTALDMTAAYLRPGDAAYVLAVCGDRYYLMVPGEGQGYAPASSFEELVQPPEGKGIVYRTFLAPEGGVSFEDEMTGEMVYLAGGVELKDCWQIEGDTEWHVTFGAGIQRTPRVRGTIPEEMLTSNGYVEFEGTVYVHGTSFIACMGEMEGKKILRRTDPDGDVFWALGEIPLDAVLLDNDLYRMACETEQLLSEAVIRSVIAYVRERDPLDERTHGKQVSDELLARCTVHAALELDPGSGKLLRIHAWLEDSDGTYVTGGDLDPKTGAITRWGCNA